MMFSLDAHLALNSSDDGHHVADFDAGLQGFGGVHGGHLAAGALKAMRTAVPSESYRPRTLTVTYLESVRPGRLDITSVAVHARATISTARSELAQGGELKASASAIFGMRKGGLDRRDLQMPEVRSPQECSPLGDEPVPGSGGLQMIHRPALGGVPLSGSGVAAGAVWMRMADDRPVDEYSVAVLADGAIPALFLAIDTFRPMPTVELAIQFADLDSAAESPWLLADIANLYAAHGWAIEDITLWTPAGALAATARQLRRVGQEA